ncbi:hypothetical protein [Cellulomonas biazotea]|uniref:Uncharacterized protein n=1 Tax=Cellulomonas biazotea TaxID=1709 RepID=A0A402DSB1_9CELL|nr:hypothetical protein [Cellulomonas biazotea]GCE76985.1 hypothetical protein CBZ_20410 [Cellulomonas biazotea]
MADLAFLALTVAFFATVALVARRSDRPTARVDRSAGRPADRAPGRAPASAADLS